MAKKRRKPTADDILRIITIIVDFISDYREKMRSREVEWTDCITMHQWDLGEFYFSLLKTKEVISNVRYKCMDSEEMIDNIYLKKKGLDVYIDC